VASTPPATPAKGTPALLKNCPATALASPMNVGRVTPNKPPAPAAGAPKPPAPMPTAGALPASGATFTRASVGPP